MKNLVFSLFYWVIGLISIALFIILIYIINTYIYDITMIVKWLLSYIVFPFLVGEKMYKFVKDL